jgi:3-hydroxyisobutyrate dehydrogenase-like beta-hydroxyacid dehydrogenase
MKDPGAAAQLHAYQAAEQHHSVGFIGLGVMGRPMATRIVDADHALVVHSRSPGPVAALASIGAQTADNAAEVARRSDMVFVMVPSTADAELVIDGPGGILQGARAGSVIIDMGSHHPSAMHDLAARCRAAGVEFLDAPVSGGEIGARDGTLVSMVGGEVESLEKVRPVLAAMCRVVVHVGAVGAGMLAKACNQLVVGSTIQAVAEALTLARAGGVDPARVRAAMLGGFAASRVLEVHGQRMLERDFEPGGRVISHAKDAETIINIAHGLGVALPGFTPVAAAFDRLLAAGAGDLDHSALVLLLEDDPDQLSQFAADLAEGSPRQR